jgi:hypothetical protein
MKRVTGRGRCCAARGRLVVAGDFRFGIGDEEEDEAVTWNSDRG